MNTNYAPEVWIHHPNVTVEEEEHQSSRGLAHFHLLEDVPSPLGVKVFDADVAYLEKVYGALCDSAIPQICQLNVSLTCTNCTLQFVDKPDTRYLSRTLVGSMANLNEALRLATIVGYDNYNGSASLVLTVRDFGDFNVTQ
eukprot:gene27141-34338_t